MFEIVGMISRTASNTTLEWLNFAENSCFECGLDNSKFFKLMLETLPNLKDFRWSYYAEEPTPAVICNYLSFLGSKISLLIAQLDTNLSLRKQKYNEPQNFQQVQNGVNAFCDRRGSNYLDLLILGQGASRYDTPGSRDLTVAILIAMKKWLEINSGSVPIRQYKYANADSNMGGILIERLPILTML